MDILPSLRDKRPQRGDLGPRVLKANRSPRVNGLRYLPRMGDLEAVLK